MKKVVKDAHKEGMNMYRIGVDLGGTNIAVGIVNETFEIIAKGSTPTLTGRPGKEIASDIAALCKKLIAEAGITETDVLSLGLASPGVSDDNTGCIIYANNLKFRNFPMLPLLKKELNIPQMHIANDANAAALGEAMAGAAKGSQSSIMITLGTGVGGGIISDGKIFDGFNHAAGELGHIVIAVDGVPCSCGRRGCWEAYSSATALIRMTKEKLDECKREGRETKMETIVAEYGKVSGRTAFDGMRAGDEAATEVVNTYIKYLAAGIANIINAFEPEILSIGGGISNEGDYLLNLLIPALRGNIYAQGRIPETTIRIAQLRGDAGIVGAAALGC